MTPAAWQEAKTIFAIHRILCPVDFSDGSQQALEHAAAIARRWGSQLTVLHVYPAPSPFDLVPGVDEGAENDPQLDLRAALWRFVQPVVGEAAVNFRLRHAVDARRAIVDEADASDADLIVIGSHGRGGVAQLLLGSAADAVVRKASCPVLVVPPCARPAGDGRFRHIVCAIDFSPAALHAFRYAIRLASRDDAEVTLVHALEMPPELRERQIAAAFDVEAVRAAAEAAARRRLEALSPGHDAPAVPTRAHVAEGPADRRIVELARQRSADLIVLGTHGRNALDRWVFGSNTHAVLRDAPCPVLTVAPE